ncbi:uncharacterized protein LOC122506354 [Leptopilina heterotoma]|uniref:uncharacterized protein LOC122506354 n=1 Tax=Leptopilina heterotoma TaxID=63436 RepID=UPI001CA9E90A|nr:uncharacterized protein LOC122506354 [Leptopilina heterotoma]
MVGPTIQNDVFAHMIRFRAYKFVLTGDLEKMYRQFRIRKEDRKFQRIFWRRDIKNIEIFELNTVTFRISSSSFLATRALQQLADDEIDRYPEAAKTLKEEVYVDDFITGADTIEKGIEKREEIINLLKLGGLNIRQWASNDPQLLEGIPNNKINLNLQFNENKTVKTLGVSWNSCNDNIIYSVEPPNTLSKISKRIILSDISKLFDPLGLLGPIILFAKILMQQIWQSKLNWDESVPDTIPTTCIDFCEQLKLINDLTFRRRFLIENPVNVQIHGFCDASQKGYGACIYVRSIDSREKIECHLLCAKSRVAPLKTITLPCLELCSAVLLSNLFLSVYKSLNMPVHEITFWTDSSIALSWINTSPHQLKTFVANRVSDIQKKTNGHNWKHVKSSDNPADSLSRGQKPAEFIMNKIWKEGPHWLKQTENTWPVSAFEIIKDSSKKKGRSFVNRVRH